MAIRASARSASSIGLSALAARCPGEEDHPLGVRRDVRVLLDHLGLAPAASRIPDRHRSPHALVELTAELLDEALLVLAYARIALRQKNFAVTRLHAQEPHGSDYVTRPLAARGPFRGLAYG